MSSGIIVYSERLGILGVNVNVLKYIPVDFIRDL